MSLYLYNVLFSEVNVGVAATTPSGDTLSTSAVNVTADNMGTFAGGTSCSAVNSVFTSVSGFLAGSSFTNCVTNVTSALLEEGLITEVGLEESDGGRPRVLLQVNGEFGAVIGVEIGETGIRVEGFDLRMRVAGVADSG